MVKRAEILQELDFIDGKPAGLVMPAIGRLEKDKDIVCMYLFGSTARGQERPESDLDFAFLLNKDYPEDALLSKRLFLIKILHENIPGKKIDAIILNEAPVVLAFKVISQGRLLFSRDEKERVHFEVRAMQNYYDFKPFLEKNLSMLKRRARRVDMVADPEIILLRLNKLEQCVKKLSELAGLSEDVFKHDEAVLDRVERNLQVAIQACIDIGSHIISSEGMKIPPNYKETFTVLQDRGILPPKLAENMKHMAGLRNILVHDYLELDAGKIYACLGHLQDFRTFAGCILQFLERTS